MVKMNLEPNEKVGQNNGGPSLDFSPDATDSPANAKDTLETLQEMSSILGTGLDTEDVAICFKLIENGVNPQKLAEVMAQLKGQEQDKNNALNAANSFFLKQ
jgi:mitotic-spindle organizing protein 1